MEPSSGLVSIGNYRRGAADQEPEDALRALRAAFVFSTDLAEPGLPLRTAELSRVRHTG